MRMYKLEVYVIDFGNLGADGVRDALELSTDYAVVKVVDSEVADIGDWSDDHELNQRGAVPETYRKYYGVKLK